ncbi:uncharacterized protein FOMMEDRAFT_150694 [Fomitiporia mediterranea MF3/22]|uniref:uncharacterized protein n=1 Tax=Fomitiporia mediterranea (strain MF3/22) TaxID=694068 RepID=UPI0004409901|nr:uncharacterized protein FOMMEDRAFT_150694 [Fomitiporia mediterranea MF3/22]EJD08035.1 hypothetical protein FOMMEDRAFT_150694 [Fomitiporia mediterranea MF3/22]
MVHAHDVALLHPSSESERNFAQRKEKAAILLCFSTSASSKLEATGDSLIRWAPPLHSYRVNMCSALPSADDYAWIWPRRAYKTSKSSGYRSGHCYRPCVQGVLVFGTPTSRKNCRSSGNEYKRSDNDTSLLTWFSAHLFLIFTELFYTEYLMIPNAPHEYEQEYRQDVLNSDEQTHSTARSAPATMSATEPTASTSTAGTTFPTSSNTDGSHPLPPVPQDVSPESSSPTPTQTIAAMRMNTANSNTGSTSVGRNGTNTTTSSGLGMGTPLPSPAPILHAQTMPSRPAPLVMPHIVESDSPSSFTSSGPSGSPPRHSRHQPSLPHLPSSPLPSRTLPQPISRSSAGISTPQRSLSFVEPPSRVPSARTYSGNGLRYYNGNGDGSGSQPDRHRTSSVITSMEKASMLFDPDAPPTSPSGRVLQVDLPPLTRNDRHRDRDSRYHDSGVAMPMPAVMSGDREKGQMSMMSSGRRSRVRTRRGDGGDDGGSGDSDSESIGVPVRLSVMPPT